MNFSIRIYYRKVQEPNTGAVARRAAIVLLAVDHETRRTPATSEYSVASGLEASFLLRFQDLLLTLKLEFDTFWIFFSS